MKPHKHAELIKAWADGAEIQQNILTHGGTKWIDVALPTWSASDCYRIKPEEKKPVVRWLWADRNGFITSHLYSEEEWKHNRDKYETLKYHTIKLEWSRTEFPE